MLKLSDVTFVEEKQYESSYEIKYIEVKNPNEKSIALVTALLSSSSFQSIFSRLIKNCSFIYDYKQGLSATDIEFLEEEYPEETKIIHKVLREYDLWDGLSRSIFLLTTFRFFIDLNPNNYPPAGFITQDADFERSNYPFVEVEPPCITFSHKISKNELITWINKNWKMMEMGISELPTSPILKDKLKNIALIDEIYQLYNEGLKIDDICDKLSVKYPDHPYVSGYVFHPRGDLCLHLGI